MWSPGRSSLLAGSRDDGWNGQALVWGVGDDHDSASGEDLRFQPVLPRQGGVQEEGSGTDSERSYGARRPERASRSASRRRQGTGDAASAQVGSSGRGPCVRRWCGSWFGFPDDFLSEGEPAFIRFAEAARAAYGLDKLAGQVEVSPTTGRPHFQWYAHFTRTQYGSRVATIFPGSHTEACKGSEGENVRYVTKDESRHERGGPWYYPSREAFTDDSTVRKNQAALALRQSILAGADPLDTVQESEDLFPEYIRKKDAYDRFFSDVHVDHGVRRRPVVVFLWGRAGVGKSRLAHNLADRLCSEFKWSKYHKPAATTHWFNYRGERVVIWDELTPQTMPMAELNCFLHEYRHHVACFYRQAEFDPVVRIITSNLDPQFWYADDPNQDTFIRRLTLVIECTIDCRTDSFAENLFGQILQEINKE